jgi:ABC-type sugar transport system ATPase subunit
MLLSARDIKKRFGSFRALDGVDLSVAAGEVHGLLGANGAGKSTLIGVLSGAIRPDAGTVAVAGQTVTLGSLVEARKAGIAVVHQELMLFPDRTVEENVFGSSLPSGSFTFVNRRDRRRRVEATMDRLGAKVDLRKTIDELPLSHRQLVEIARALCSGGRVLVLDEPTSALSQPEAHGLFGAIRSIVAHDAAVIFVSHRLDEVFSLADRITVLRDGHVEGSWRAADVDIPIVTRAMMGELANEKPPVGAIHGNGEIALQVHGSGPGTAPIHMTLKAGEVVGLAGLEGSGVSTVLEMLGGVVEIEGEAEVLGRPVKFHHPSDALRHGVVYMPPDRKKDGLWLEQTVSANIAMAEITRMRPLTWLRREWSKDVAMSRMRQVSVPTNALAMSAGHLSGGNQQRVLLARSLALHPRVLLLNDFTRGVDVKAKAAIHRLVRDLAGAGVAVCVTSSDLEELLVVSDRVVCMRSGRVVADRPSSSLDKLSLLQLVSTDSEGADVRYRATGP